MLRSSNFEMKSEHRAKIMRIKCEIQCYRLTSFELVVRLIDVVCSYVDLHLLLSFLVTEIERLFDKF